MLVPLMRIVGNWRIISASVFIAKYIKYFFSSGVGYIVRIPHSVLQPSLADVLLCTCMLIMTLLVMSPIITGNIVIT